MMWLHRGVPFPPPPPPPLLITPWSACVPEALHYLSVCTINFTFFPPLLITTSSPQTDELRTKVDSAAMIAGCPDMKVPDTTPIEDDQYDETAEYIEKLLADLVCKKITLSPHNSTLAKQGEFGGIFFLAVFYILHLPFQDRRLKNKISIGAACKDLLEQMQLLVREGEDMEEDLSASEAKLRKLRGVIAAERERLVERAHEAGVPIPAHAADCADGALLDMDVETEVALQLITAISFEANLEQIVATEAESRANIEASYTCLLSSLPGLRIYQRVSDCVRSMGGLEEAKKAAEVEAADLAEAKRMETEVAALAAENRRKEQEVEELKQAYKVCEKIFFWIFLLSVFWRNFKYRSKRRGK